MAISCPGRSRRRKRSGAGPVISTWPSSSRHSMVSVPPSSSTSTLRSVRPRRMAATAVAQAPVPQARSRPRRAPTPACGCGAVAAPGRIRHWCGWERRDGFRSSGPVRVTGACSASSTNRTQWGLPIRDRGGGYRSTLQGNGKIFGVDGLGQGDLAPVEPGGAHIHRHQALAGVAADQHAALAVQLDAGQAAFVHQQPRHAARGVAAGFHFAAIGVEEAQARIHLGVARRDQDHRIAADAEMPVGDGLCPAAMSWRMACSRASNTTKSLPRPCILRKGIMGAL